MQQKSWLYMKFWHLTVTVIIVKNVLLDHSNALGFVLWQFQAYVKR